METAYNILVKIIILVLALVFLTATAYLIVKILTQPTTFNLI